MAWGGTRSWTTGELVTAALGNVAWRDNIDALRAGGIALTSQAQYDLAYATNASQWQRLATGTGFLRADGAGPSWTAVATSHLPAGTIIQVVQGTTTTVASSTSSTYADSNLTAAITPRSTSNKVLVLGAQRGCYAHTSDTGVKLKLVRTIGGTPADVEELSLEDGVDNSSGDTSHFSIPLDILDSPATTSAITYKTQFASSANSDGVSVQLSSVKSTIVLMEVVA